MKTAASGLIVLLVVVLAGKVESAGEISCGVNKICVAPQHCHNGRVNTLGATLIDVRFGFSECAGIDVCCHKGNVTSTPNLAPMETAPCCGHRNVNGVGIKVIEATTETDFGEFPWMLAVMHKLKRTDGIVYMTKCGASLIHPRIALTAAHHVSGPADDFKVRAGEWEPYSESEPYPHEDRFVKEVVAHPKHDNVTQLFDAALLILESPFVLKPHINTICLPAVGRESAFNRCFATGWGKLEFGRNRYPKLLKKIIVMVLPKVLCHYDLRKTRLGTQFELHDSFICAEGQDDTDACTGDGGSPLVCPMEGKIEDAARYYQAGVVSWGIGCGQKMTPGVYVNVAFIRTWIDEELALRGIKLLCQ